MNPSSFRTIEQADFAVEGGVLRFVTPKSAALKGRGDVTLYIPEQAASETDVPVVILLHGVYCSHWAWALKGRAHESLQDMIRKCEVPSMILAMPSDGLWGDGSGYFRHNGQDFEKWIVEEIPLLVSEVTGNGIHSPHFIAGLSMGGYGALCMGAKHPQRFSAFSAHSSATTFADMLPFVEESAEDFSSTGPSAADLILENRDKELQFRFDCGTEDPLIEPNRLLASQLRQGGVEFSYEEFPGGHEWPYWEQHVRRSFRFFADCLT